MEESEEYARQHTLRHGGLLRNILESEVAKKMARSRDWSIFSEITKDIRCGTFGELEELSWFRIEWRQVIVLY